MESWEEGPVHGAFFILFVFRACRSSQVARAAIVECREVDLGLVSKHVGVGVSGDGEVTLPDLLADPRPGHAAEVQQRDTAMPQVVG